MTVKYTAAGMLYRHPENLRYFLSSIGCLSLKKLNFICILKTMCISYIYVREMVDAMHEKMIPKGVYVIREGILLPQE